MRRFALLRCCVGLIFKSHLPRNYVVFSFFKRTGEEPQTMTPPKLVAPKPPPGASASSATVAPTLVMPASDGVEFEDHGYDTISTSAESHSAVEEAAILYANERIDEAAATLLGFLKENIESKDINPWMLLFDLYQVQNMKHPFDELSMEFVVRFERSAPVWEGPRQAAPEQKTAPKASMAGSVQFKGIIGAEQATDFERVLKLASSGSGVKLDLSKVTGVEVGSAMQFATVLQTIRRAEQRVSASGAKEFIQCIKILLDGEARQEKNYWALLFELYQLSGQEEAFEDAAVDYAVTFELSPPSWEALSELVQIAQAEEPEAVVEEVVTDCFIIDGALATGTEYKLRDLERFADTRTQVEIDMTSTTRVGFVTVGAFINAIIALNQKGKQVTINGANEMVHALFDVMGVTEYATVVRRKQR